MVHEHARSLLAAHPRAVPQTRMRAAKDGPRWWCQVVVVVVRIANGAFQQTHCHRGSLATPLGLSNLQGGKRRNFPSSLSQPPCGRPAPSER